MEHSDVHIIGGGTINHIRSHLALAAPAYGHTAKRIKHLWSRFSDRDATLHLTKMADPDSHIETFDDILYLVITLVKDKRTKIIFFNPAICDFTGRVAGQVGDKYGERLKSEVGVGHYISLNLEPLPKLINLIRKGSDKFRDLPIRKDIFLVGFKTTTGANLQEQYIAGLKLLKQSSCNLVLANDVKTRHNMVIVPEEASYYVTTDREEALQGLVNMVQHRAGLHFTNSTVVDGKSIPWSEEKVYPSLKAVVDWCIRKGAYKPFLGVTAGHFAMKVSNNVFYTSKRKTDFNKLSYIGLVQILTNPNKKDEVIAYGAKPSVGGQSQRILFAEHPEYDCIVHFHCPRRYYNSDVSTVPQIDFECGSHECGQNTSNGLKRIDDKIAAVYLDNHGPNILFHHSIHPNAVIQYINDNFDITQKTGGPVELELS